MVKIEGGDWLVDTVKMLTERAVPVCAHLGLTPQSVNIFGGYKIQGRDQEKADRMVKDALALQEAGCSNRPTRMCAWLNWQSALLKYSTYQLSVSVRVT